MTCTSSSHVSSPAAHSTSRRTAFHMELVMLTPQAENFRQFCKRYSIRMQATRSTTTSGRQWFCILTSLTCKLAFRRFQYVVR
jgi:hypothetical protein